MSEDAPPDLPQDQQGQQPQQSQQQQQQDQKDKQDQLDQQDQHGQHDQQQHEASLRKIQTLLRTKDDTSRFVGLALLKSVLDNSPELRSDENAIVALWESISPKFLDRLIRTGSKQQPSRSPQPSDASGSPHKTSSDMLDLAVSVLHTFAALLPDHAKQNARLLDRIPQLVACLLHW